VLTHPDEELAAFFPSVVDDPPPPEGAGPAFRDFCAAHLDDLGTLLRTRMVQTNVVRRGVAMRYGLSQVPGTDPVHLVEVGASAGILLRHDRYRLQLGDRTVGPDDATVHVTSEWRGAGPAPDIAAGPALAGVLGADLHPMDPTSAEDRRWLRALVWPENHPQAAELEAALAVVAADPPRIVAGDIRDLADQLDAELPPGQPRVAYHSATRGHLPADEQSAFDDAVDRLGTSAPLTVLSVESPHSGDPRSDSDDPHFVLRMRQAGEAGRDLAYVEGHGAWIEPARG
jgi:hypothetical protein